MLEVLDRCKFVSENSKDVSINRDAINELSKTIKESDLTLSNISLAVYNWKFEQLLALTFIFNSINFCFWSEKNKPKWLVELNGEKLDGAIALFRCLEEEAKKNPDLLTGRFLQNINTKYLERVFLGNTVMPLIQERKLCLVELGSILVSRFNNSFINILDKASRDAVHLTNIMVDGFPSFKDASIFKDVEVSFHKRAQLNSKMIHDLLIEYKKPGLSSLENLTAFADYKIPQTLRKVKILSYSKDLADKVDNLGLIEANSIEEIEIRANSVIAVDELKKLLVQKYSYVTSSHLDSMLWNISQIKTDKDQPYHRTYTIAY